MNDDCCGDPECDACETIAHIEGIYEGVAMENARGIDGVS